MTCVKQTRILTRQGRLAINAQILLEVKVCICQGHLTINSIFEIRGVTTPFVRQ